MAPSSQTFSQGGIRSRDWFSDRLDRGGDTDGESTPLHRSPFTPSLTDRATTLPVEGVAHLNGDQHRQRHGHGVR